MSEADILLDTHVWIWIVEGNRSRIGKKAAQEVERASRRACDERLLTFGAEGHVRVFDGNV